MEDLFEVRRRNRAGDGKWISHLKPYIKLEMPRGQVVVFNRTATLLGVKEGDAVMFSISKKNKCGFIYKEDPEPDSYYLQKHNRDYFRMTSKELGNYFKEVFELPAGKKSFYFELEEKANEKEQFKFTLHH